MTHKNLFLKSNITYSNIRGKMMKNLSKKFDQIFLEIKADIKNTKKTLNVLDDNFKFSFQIKDLKNLINLK